MGPPPAGHWSLDASDAPRILVVDDVQGGAAATIRMLQAGGYHGIAEADGDAALRFIRATFTRLVISELYIPSSEGTCLVTALKNERHHLPRLQVLVHTRHTSERDIDWALDAGCDVVVWKTASAGVLLREVERLEGIAGTYVAPVGAP
jgi:CheY-like chemotaxis protein